MASFKNQFFQNIRKESIIHFVQHIHKTKTAKTVDEIVNNPSKIYLFVSNFHIYIESLVFAKALNWALVCSRLS